ncbi:Transposon Ty3-G Gag-Pol poly [Labeo rohita]|uniref:ribonuclease H n=2 Tax=Labeo rohita TaxID=84645 RepID=A0A498MM04_LABRO|nr:Transposon Ty3-G Gag-Pol poly [Labeo rohita]
MTSCFGDLNFTHLLIYLDDIIIFSKSFNEHLERLQLAFDRLREHGLKLKPSKCQLVRKEVQYLGHLVSAEGTRTDPEKFHDHLYGRKFSVLTDNNPLKYVMTSAKLDATGQRWVSHLSIYDFDIQYRRGQDNSNADALSRMSNQEVGETLQSSPQQVRMGGSRHEEAQTTREPEEVSGEDKTVVEEPESGQPLEPSEVYVDVGMETLPAMTTQELRAGQKEDPVISPILHFKSRNHKPSHRERMKLGATGSLLLKEWRKLVIKKGILYRSVRLP